MKMGLALAIVAAVCAFAPRAEAAACITDAEVEAAVGADLRAGVFAIRTDKLGSRPLCSGLTMAQTVQKLRDSYFPAEARPAPPERSRLAEPPPTAPSAPATRQLAALDGYVGKYHRDKVKGYAFRDHPGVIAALNRAGVPADLRRDIRQYDVTTPIARQGDVIINSGCFPHNCGDENYKLFISQRTGRAALCLFDGHANWYAEELPSRPLIIADACADTPDEAPVDVREALGIETGYAASAPDRIGNAGDPAGSPAGLQGPALAQLLVGNWEITGTEVEDPQRCISARNEVQFDMAKFKADGRYDYIGQDGGGTGRWSLSGRILRATIDGETYSSTVRVISRDHLLVRYNVANGSEERYRRCFW